ncbi:hypothetical protein TEA_009357 [Camellia sinensis var. sinensis]|uniref:Uncharacterized protein n=1 Tax=Camellia sinensis var. sinensis TaxID=542762 RepID=A0A4S4ECT8_CAMSN|nr:hypothetical protein TEA_009357 [Camellia sinensis var. sinensis]
MNWTSLSNLEKLYLIGCYLTGSIPEEIGSLSKLTRLYLSANHHLEEFGKLENLVKMHLGGSSLHGLIPVEIGDLTQFTYLNLKDNLLKGKIPSSIGQLMNLKFLDMSANQINNTIPTELGHLSNLQTIMKRHPGELLSSFESLFARNITLTDVLDPCLLPPTNPIVVGNIVLVARMAIACLRSEPRSHPTMLLVSQEFHYCRKTCTTPLCAISLLQARNAEIDFHPINE